jgi:hypothetical protein
MAKGQLIVALDFSGIAEDEFHDWFDTEHLPERERVPGFLSCRRWISVQNPKEAVHLFDLDVVGMTPPAAAETEFNVWYDTEHIPALARVPGVLCARRFKGGSSPRYVALYHLSAPEVIDGADWKRASESTPMPAHIRPRIADRVRFVCRRYLRGV